MLKFNRPLAVLTLGLAARFVALAASQTITFDAIPNQIFGVSPFAIAAQASSRLPIAFSAITPAVCKTASNLVMLLSAGSCSVTASQSGDSSFSSAASVTRTFTVSLAKPSGTLTPSVGSPFAAGTYPNSVATGDFNNDGIQDLVVANSGSNNITVLLGDGASGFSPAPGSPFTAEINPYAVVVGDFNGDGYQDLAVSGANDGTVTILLGNGSGGFSSAPGGPFAVGAPARSLAVGDFNGDGIQDLVTGNSNGFAGIFLGTGSGTFVAAPSSPFAIGYGPAVVAVGDFNGDGMQDIAAADGFTGQLAILTGDGSGGFASLSFGLDFGSGVGVDPVALAVGDFNGDGIPDIAVACAGNVFNVILVIGQGSGRFSLDPASPHSLPGIPNSIVVGDFNGDGYQDIALTEKTGNIISVLSGNGAGLFSSQVALFVSSGFPIALVAGDFNGDGLQDLAVASNGYDSVTLFLGGLAEESLVLSTTASPTISIGQSVQLSLAVSNSTPVLSAPTGTATFEDGATVLGTAPQTAAPFSFTATGLGLGNHALTATYSGDIRDSGFTSNTVMIQVNPPLLPQSIAFAPLGAQTAGSSSIALSATASSGLAVSFISNTTTVCTVAGTALTLPIAGTCSITASQAGNTTYAAATPVTQSFTVKPASQTISFGPIGAQPAGSSPSVLSATASSGLTVSFSSNTPAVCTLVVSVLTALTPGTCSITASQAGNATYAAAAPVTQTFTVSTASQTINFPAVPNEVLPALPFGLTATSSSGLPISFASLTPAVCSVTGYTLTPLAGGTCTVTATQPGNSTYAPATPVTRSWTITAAPGTNLMAAPSTLTIDAVAGDVPSTQTILLEIVQAPSQSAPTFTDSVQISQGSGWLSASPVSGTMTFQLAEAGGDLYTAVVTLQLNPMGIAASGVYTGAVNFSSAGSSVSVPVTLDVSGLPLPTGGIANAASGGQAPPSVVAPGSYIAIYGLRLAGTGNPSAASLPLPDSLNGTQVTIAGPPGVPLPLLYAAGGQINALVPTSLTPGGVGAYPLYVTVNGMRSAPVPLYVVELQPGIYSVDTSGSGPGIVTNALTSQLIDANNPAHAGDYLVIYCTGLGLVHGPNGEAPPADGTAAPNAPLFSTTATVTATIGGVVTPVLFSGLTPTLAALYQVNVQVPSGVSPGSAVPVVLKAMDVETGASALSNSVTIALQ